MTESISSDNNKCGDEEMEGICMEEGNENAEKYYNKVSIWQSVSFSDSG